MSGVAEILLSRDMVVIVDFADFDWLNQWKWSASFHRGGKGKYRALPGNSLNRAANENGNTTSRFKGVYWQKDIGRWRAKFRDAYLGTFTDEKEAAQAYDMAAMEYDAVFAYVNFGQGDEHCQEQ